jgi:serine/threonine protein kinase/formylglycine-generating enzyme required for sulfatase activity
MKDPNLTICHQPKTEVPTSQPQSQPQHIGRYRIERTLGKGGFGLVYLAHDDQLQRLVAIKVPQRQQVSMPEDAQAYLNEARTVASLDHPNIVSVYDVGSTQEFPCYVVSKYIDGTDLATRLEQSRLSLHEAVELVATVADALHHAHKQGLVHRDIKPGNILLDRSGKPFVGDFGLALREQDLGMGPRFAGTPSYMSPEQSRGEGHRVDGRSDIFSLGIVFYQLLTERLPFHAKTESELAEQLSSMEVRPLRQWVDTIPSEIERICLKALAKRASERYATAKDLANDLWHFLTLASKPASGSAADGAAASSGPFASALQAPSGAVPALVKIIPKGLRSYDNHDADFFLELIPGPRDRDGLPDSIRFWKAKIEETDEDKTFSVGLIYGPSGCGKSSLVKAGLLPRLSKDVIAIYVEATADETEVRLLGGLRKALPTLPPHLTLKDALAAVRREHEALTGKKVLIVLDQFEQWLHAVKERRHTELVEALRQCDGRRLQCIVMVRDDFWLAVSRFLKELEIPLLEGRNSALVDLFDTDHARKVLAAFGRAFGKLPHDANEMSAEHKKFLDLAVADLAPEGKVICVRLALFADMMKSKTWSLAALKAVGGTAGVRVTFLEETFSAATAPPQHRMHQQAARAVLKELLPEAGTDLKGHMRSYGELLEASGYRDRPGDFDDLLRILDSELRLITPTDPEGKESAGSSGDQDAADARPTPAARFYQLTHDYLVPSLRDWLTRKKKESRHGRAELLLEDLASVWTMRPERRQLPSLLQWLQILRLTRQKSWTAPQRLMMTTATRHHAARALLAVMFVATLGWAGLAFANSLREQNSAKHAEALVGRLLVAKTPQAPGIVVEIDGYRQWADPLLREANARAAPGSAQKLHISLALLPTDAGQVGFLFERLLEAEPQEVSVVRDALATAPGRAGQADKLWDLLRQSAKDKEPQRLRAAAALAGWAPNSAQWAAVNNQVASDLVQVPTVHLETWLDCLGPVAASLLSPLAAVSRDGKRPESERCLATDILAVYAKNDVNTLADLLMDADEKQFAAVFPAFQAHGAKGAAVLHEALAKMLAGDDDAKEKLAKRQANAAVALVRMKQAETVWPLLKFSADPRVRSYVIHRFAPLGAAATPIALRLEVEPDITAKRALILSLGEYDRATWPESERSALTAKMRDIYQTTADPGLRAAAEWLLRSWSDNPWLDESNVQWAKDRDKREATLRNIAKQLANGSAARPAGWYVAGQGHTMIIIPGPTTFLMGSPTTEAYREDGPTSQTEALHKKRIARSFAIADKEVTAEQFQRYYRDTFQSNYKDLDREYSPHPDCPVNRVSWYQAAAYCNWLSLQEGISRDQWYYETNAAGNYDEGMKSVPGRTGYRLPTEAEWEYACRSETSTSRYFGETEELLPKYAWYSKNAQDRGMLPGVPGRFGEQGLTLKPNDFGMFGMLGNALEWCHTKFDPYGDGDDTESQETIDAKTFRMLRGGSFNYLAGSVRAAYRVWRPPTWRMDIAGFRPARTISPAP